jgi:hypothetical protein
MAFSWASNSLSRRFILGRWPPLLNQPELQNAKKTSQAADWRPIFARQSVRVDSPKKRCIRK